MLRSHKSNQSSCKYNVLRFLSIRRCCQARSVIAVKNARPMQARHHRLERMLPSSQSTTLTTDKQYVHHAIAQYPGTFHRYLSLLLCDHQLYIFSLSGTVLLISEFIILVIQSQCLVLNWVILATQLQCLALTWCMVMMVGSQKRAIFMVGLLSCIALDALASIKTRQCSPNTNPT